MKKGLAFFYLVGLVTIFSCNSNNDEDLLSTPSVEKFITTVVSQKSSQEHPDYYDPNTFIYQNNRLIKYWAYDCTGTLYEFEYGSNGKISKIYYGGTVTYDNIGNSIISQDNLIAENIYNDSDQLISQNDSDGNTIFDIEYDNVGRINKIQYYKIGQSFTTIYSNFDGNGNPLQDNEGYTFTYDDKVNPIYVLFQKFGFLNFDMCLFKSWKQAFYLTPNNINETIEVDNGNKLWYSAIYTYDNDGYPTSKSYMEVILNDEITDVETIDY